MYVWVSVCVFMDTFVYVLMCLSVCVCVSICICVLFVCVNVHMCFCACVNMSLCFCVCVQRICHFALVWRGSGTLSTEVLAELNDLNPTPCIAQIIKDFDLLARIKYDRSESQWIILKGKVENISETKYVARKNPQFWSAPLFWAPNQPPERKQTKTNHTE